MSTIRIQKTNQFFTMHNSVVIDQELNDEAFRLYAYLMSQADNWVIYNANLKNKFNWGERKLQKALKSLKTAGYLQRFKTQNKNGQFCYETTIFEEKNKEIVELHQETAPTFCMNGESAHAESIDAKCTDITNTEFKQILNITNTNNILAKKTKSDFDISEEVKKTNLNEENQAMLVYYWTESKKGAKTQLAFNLILKELYKVSQEQQLTLLTQAYQGKWASITIYPNSFGKHNQVGTKSSYHLDNELKQLF